MRYRHKAGIEAAPMQDETILYNPTTNEFCVLNATAALLWGLLEEPRTVEELSAELAVNFAGVDEEGATTDVTATLDQFTELDMLERDE